MKAVRFLLVAAAALFVAACLPVTTKNPVGSTVGFKADPALIGLWKAHGEKGDWDGYFAFLKNRNDESMTALTITPNAHDGEWDTYTLKTAMLGSNRYMNARFAIDNGKPVDEPKLNSDFVLLYHFGSGGKLTLYLLDEKATAAAIKAGKIQGTIDPGENGDVHITAEPAVLDAFFARKEALALFSKRALELHRVK